MVAALRGGVANQAEGKDRELGYFGDDLCALADRAFLDLGNDRKQQVTLLHFLVNLSSPQVAIGVRQRKPKTVEEVVTATLELD